MQLLGDLTHMGEDGVKNLIKHCGVDPDSRLLKLPVEDKRHRAATL